jgi:signal transduction histidine kinase
MVDSAPPRVIPDAGMVAPDAWSTSDRAHRRRWLTDRRFVFGALGLVAPIAIVAWMGSMTWLGQPFPGFFVMQDGLIPPVSLQHWSGTVAGVPVHARITAIDGRPIASAADVYAHATQVPVGTPVEYTLAKHDEIFVRRVPTMRFTGVDYVLSLGLLVVFGVAAIGIALAVGIVQPGLVATRAFVVQGVVTALFGLTGTMLYHPALWWTSSLHLLAQAAVPASLIELGLAFPVQSPLRARRLWRAFPWALTAALAPWMVVQFYADPPRTTALHLSYVYTVAAIFALIALAAAARVHTPSPRVLGQVRVVLPGLVFGLAASVYGFANNALDGGNFPLQLIALFPPIFYLSVAWAIARHDLFDIDGPLKGVLVYGLVSVIVAGVFVSLTALAGWLGAPMTRGWGGATTLAFFVAVAMLVEPLRWRVQTLVDRTFLRNRPDYRRTVMRVGNSLTALLDTDDILASVGRTISEAFHSERLHILLWLEPEGSHWEFDGEALVRRSDVIGLPALRAHLANVPDRLLERDTVVASPLGSELDSLGAALAVPLALGRQAVGAFVLGPRRSHLRYATRDRQLLATLAAQTAIALANAQSYRALQRLNEGLEDTVRARTAALEHALVEREALQAQVVHQEKMASLGVLVAGVAHEINNPVSFIVGTVPPLRQAIAEVAARAVSETDRTAIARMSEMVEVVAAGAERTAGIVQDLRAFSRLGETQVRAINLHDTLDVVLRLLRPRWADRITVSCEYGELPLVEAAPEQISQVVMNLLLNACDAIPASGNIRVRTAVEGDMAVLTVRDDGDGIPPEVQSRIFDPFFSTKPSGRGTGLGLSISLGIVERHGGRLALVESTCAGTEFRVSLPIRSAGI